MAFTPITHPDGVLVLREIVNAGLNATVENDPETAEPAIVILVVCEGAFICEELVGTRRLVVRWKGNTLRLSVGTTGRPVGRTVLLSGL